MSCFDCDQCRQRAEQRHGEQIPRRGANPQLRGGDSGGAKRVAADLRGENGFNTCNIFSFRSVPVPGELHRRNSYRAKEILTVCEDRRLVAAVLAPLTEPAQARRKSAAACRLIALASIPLLLLLHEARRRQPPTAAVSTAAADD